MSSCAIIKLTSLSMSKKKKHKYPKVGLALSGGSALGMAHIGVIKALRENDIPIDCIAGTSAGAIVGAALAFGISPEKMLEFSDQLSWSSLSEFAYSRAGLNSNRPLGKKMIELIGDVEIEDAPIPLAIVATDIDKGDRKSVV